MDFFSLVVLAAALSMDAFAVSICEGLALCRPDIKRGVLIGVFFGVFQAMMPLVGYFFGIRFSEKVQKFDHWIAFILLALLGIKMIRESLKKKCPAEPTAICKLKPENSPFNLPKMLVLSVATSIDALAVGITFAFLDVNIISAVCLIGIITMVVCTIGVKIGNMFGIRYKSVAELAGGIILFGMGLKILIEHLSGI